MENMNIENVVEEVTETVEEVIPATVQKNGVSMGGAVIAAIITYGTIEGIKWVVNKGAKFIQDHKAKKNKAVKDEDDIETPIGDMPDEEDIK